MRNRILAAAAALTVVLLGACTPRPASQIASTASVTVDGNDRSFHIVNCHQFQWTRLIDIGGDFAGAKVVIDEGAQPASAQSVRIQNLGGFTGTYSRGVGDAADMSMSGDKITVSGTASGFKTDKPGEPASATFKITASC